VVDICQAPEHVHDQGPRQEEEMRREDQENVAIRGGIIGIGTVIEMERRILDQFWSKGRNMVSEQSERRRKGDTL
jgi:hypothetical protein